MVEVCKTSLDCSLSRIVENESDVLSLETVGVIFTNDPLAFNESWFEETVNLEVDNETDLLAQFPISSEL